MRTFRMIGTVLLTVVMCMGFASCSNDEEEPEIVTTPKEYTVSLGLAGEIVDITESPLTRVTSNDLYGIQVYCYPASKTIDREYPNAGSGDGITPYAYGLFDDVSEMTVKLMDGYKYDFVVNMVVDGKTKIYHDSSGYCYPFDVTNEGHGIEARLTNSFTYSSSVQFEGLDNDWVYNINGETSMKADIYYGEALDFVPSEGGILTVDMKRMSFGLKFIAEGLTGGTLDIKTGDYENIRDSHFTITYPDTECENILFFEDCDNVYRRIKYRGDPYYDYEDDNYFDEDGCYKEETTITLSWIKVDGVTAPLGDYTITVKRNKLTTITVKMMEGSAVNGARVGVNMETEPMGTGTSYVVENGTATETTE